MSKFSLRLGLAIILAACLLGACSPKLPNDVHVDILPLSAKQLSLQELRSAFSGNSLTPPLYEQPAGSNLYGIVIPFDIRRLPEGIDYSIVVVHVAIVKDTGGNMYPENKDVNPVTAIPLSVDYTSDKTTSSKIAASMTAAISALSGTVTAEQSTNETYQKLYRSVTAHITPNHEIYWEFTPFLDEPIQPGLYYVVGVLDVPMGTTGNLLIVSAGCSYSASLVAGLSKESTACTSGETQNFYIP